MQLKVRVESVAVGDEPSGVLKSARPFIAIDLEGIVGDRHRGFTKPADGRDPGIKRGTLVRNWRQWSAVSVEELAIVAQRLNIERLDPLLLGANITISGIDNFTQIPKGSTIHFPDQTILTVESENEPCIGPGKEIAKLFPRVIPAHFPKLAMRLRGLVGVVYRAGFIKPGDEAIIDVYQV